MNGQSLQSILNSANTAVDAGFLAYNDGRYEIALGEWRVAFSRFQSLIGFGHDYFRPNAARAILNIGMCLRRIGRPNEALSSFETSWQEYYSLQHKGYKKGRYQAAYCLFQMAAAVGDLGQLKESIKINEMALKEMRHLAIEGDENAETTVAAINLNMGISHKDSGNLDEAARCYRNSILEFRSLISRDRPGLYFDLAHALAALGGILALSGQFDEAILNQKEALAIYQSLAKTGHKKSLSSIADTLMNIGVTLTMEGSPEKASPYYLDALEHFQKLIDDGSDELRAYMASARVNFSQSLRLERKNDEALVQLLCSLKEFQSLTTQGHSTVQWQVARTLMSIGSVFCEINLWNDALEHFTKALNIYGKIIETGQEQFRFRRALTLTHMAIAQHKLGHQQDAEKTRDQSLREYVELVRIGQHQYRKNLLQAAIECVEYEFLVTPLNAESLADRLSLLTELTRSNDQVTDKLRLDFLQAGLNVFRIWDIERQKWLSEAEPVDTSVMDFFAAWLNRMHEFLIDGSPAYVLRSFDAEISPMLHQVLGLLTEHGRPEQVALWHLRTQGLRAQRQSLLQAEGDDPDLAELVRLYAKLDELAHRISGSQLARRHLPDLGSYEADGADDRLDRYIATEPINEGQAARIQSDMLEYERIKQSELEPLKKKLTQEGKLPQTPRLLLDGLRERLTTLAEEGRRAVLLMLLPAGAKEMELKAVCIYAERGQDRLMGLPIGQTMGADLHDAWSRLLQDARLRASGRSGGASMGWRGGVTETEHQVIASATAAAATAAVVTSARLLSAEEHTRLLHEVCLGAAQTLLPWLKAFQDQGLNEVHVIPAGDWHLVPWAAELDQCLPGLAVRQFPTAVGWWKATAEAERTQDSVTSWAALADAANEQSDDKQLMWVGAELAGLERLWKSDKHGLPPLQVLDPVVPQWPPAQASTQEEDVQGLVCMGHGDAPEGNLALAGMWLPARLQTKEKSSPWFTAGQLHQVRQARRLVMSCCVLGRIGDANGEPLGMTALAFAFRTKMAVGAMLPIPDLEGALFSLAVHYAWSSAERTGNADAVNVFHETRRQVMAGSWPQGFGDWLVNEWWPALQELTEEQDPAAPLRMQWLYGGKEEPGELIGQWAQAPWANVRTVAAVSSCLG